MLIVKTNSRGELRTFMNQKAKMLIKGLIFYAGDA